MALKKSKNQRLLSSIWSGDRKTSHWQGIRHGMRSTTMSVQEGTGGKKGYEKKHPERGWKVPVKWSGCACSLIVKIYPHTPCVLEKYNSEQSHPIGHKNVCYTQLSKDTHIRITEMIRMGISHAKIVCDKTCRLMN